MVLHAIELNDLVSLAASDAPDFPSALRAYVDQPEPPRKTPLPDGYITPEVHRARLDRARMSPSAKRRKEEATAAWAEFLAQTEPPLPGRFVVGDLLLEIYARNTEPGRRILFEVIETVPFKFGVWKGLKKLFKLAQETHDAEMFGALGARFDVAYGSRSTGEVSIGTLLYLRRRAWRFLRELGRAVPELYPQLCVQLLRHYPETTNFQSTWAPNHIWAHDSKNYDDRNFFFRGDDLVSKRAYPDAWKRAPAGADALMLLLETCRADMPARFAIQSLKKDFPERLRAVTPAWLERLAYRPLASAHDFLVETLLASPELHQGKLRAVGLHGAVLALLRSPSQKARAYAIEYARAHAQDMPKEQLAELVELRAAFADVKTFAASMLEVRKPKDLGVPFLGRLLASRETMAFAAKSLHEGFDRNEVPESFLVEMVYGVTDQLKWVVKYVETKYRPKELRTSFWIGILDDARRSEKKEAVRYALHELGKYAFSEIGVPWLLDALTTDDLGDTVARWLSNAEALPGLDVERVKGLVFHPKHRAVALKVLGNPKIVRPKDLTLPWLLALAKRADPTLHEFASRYLLQHMKPEDFVADVQGEGGAPTSPTPTTAAAGIARLFAMAMGAKQGEPIRLFAQTYLKYHHPVLGPEQAESKALQLVPALDREAYTAERIWPGLFDDRDDVRRFALAITKVELRRWGWQTKVYDLADSAAKDVRAFAYEALLKAGDPTADPACTLTPEELDPAEVFLLTESIKKSTREVGVELINRHYDRLGGPERLAWLMQSADREVRVLAVRLLWEKHRPRDLPPGWKPKLAASPTTNTNAAERFPNVDVLRDFLRRVMFAVPPGRSLEARTEAAGRRISSSEAKRRLIDIVRDLGVEDPAFAQLVAPVLIEFTGSAAKTEWQACLAAFLRIKSAHPAVDLGAPG